MMRKFDYFLFENFDAEEQAGNTCNPRTVLGVQSDNLLSYIAGGNKTFQDTVLHFGEKAVNELIHCGVIRREDCCLFFDCPVFLREDAEVIQKAFLNVGSRLTDILEKAIPAIRANCQKIENGFGVEENLYHILCGMVFDGRMFDFLSKSGEVAIGREHPSGLNYLSVIYEKCPELQLLSEGLLCSYNRLVNETILLQSFGDSFGNRHDFYRLYRFLEQGKVPERFQEAMRLLGCLDRATIMQEVLSLIRDGKCSPAVLNIMEALDYAVNGQIVVPIFLPEHRCHIEQISTLVESNLGHHVIHSLNELSSKLEISAVRHGVNKTEIVNEFYHILFGFVNEELVKRGVVKAPRYFPGEGRYLKCIEVIR